MAIAMKGSDTTLYMNIDAKNVDVLTVSFR